MANAYYRGCGTARQPADGSLNGEEQNTQQTTPGGRFTFPATSLTVNRMGYGAMQLAGREGNNLVWGPPKDVDGAIAVLREAVARGVNHIDTSDFYGPHVTNQNHPKGAVPLPERSGDRDESQHAARSCILARGTDDRRSW